jgi:fructoselysine-6-P-deglycase FrlB-like protein
MTNREFYKAVIGAEVSEELKEFAKSEIEKLDKKNEKRKNTQTKEQKANEGIKSQIVDFIKENGASVASVIANGCGISTQKASALCKLLVEEKAITVADIKVKNKGTLKQYAVVVADTESDSE